MTVDLQAEREASQERVEKQRAEDWLNYRARRLRTEPEATTLEEGAQELFPDLSDEQRASVVERAREQMEAQRMPNPPKVMTSQEMVRRGAEIFKRDPELSSRVVYQELAAGFDGVLGITVASWMGGYSTKARKLARGDLSVKSAGSPKKARATKATRKPPKASGPVPTPTPETAEPERSVVDAPRRAVPTAVRPVMVVHPDAATDDVRAALEQAGYAVIESSHLHGFRCVSPDPRLTGGHLA